MFYKIKRTLFAIALLPLALGCKRETLTEQQAVATGSVATYKVQQWIKNHPLSLSGQGRTAGNTLPRHTLQWAQAIYNPSSRAHTVPLLLAQEGNVRPPLQAVLVATEDASGQIESAQYMLLLPNGKTGGQIPFKGLEANGLPIGQADFSGTMLFYNSAGMFTTSKVFKEGRLQTDAAATLAARKKPRAAANGSQAARTGEAEEDPSPNKALINCEGLDDACIEWYWQTYVNGQLVDEEYLFTTCCFTNGGGTGTGINNLPSITSCERTQAQAQSIIAGIQLENTNNIVSVNGQPYGTNANEPIRMPKQVRWGFLRLRQYLEYYLRYTMVFNGVVFRNNAQDNVWKWESLGNGELHRSGTLAPCMSIEFTYSVVPPVISPDKRYATSSITYTAKASVPCLLGVEVGTYSGSHPYVEFNASLNYAD